PIAASRTAVEYRADPGFPETLKEPLPSLFAERDVSREQWAMAIDLTACIGCGACAVACQAENNLLVVAKEGVLDSREMHWRPIEPYREHDGRIHERMACQHCENAPCEYV